MSGIQAEHFTIHEWLGLVSDAVAQLPEFQRDVHGFISGMKACALLRNATDDSTVDLACRVALYKARRTRGGRADWEKLAGWRIGESFREAAQRCCRDSAESFAAKLLRAVAETVDNENLTDCTQAADRTRWKQSTEET